MTLLLYLFVIVVVVPFLTYWAIGLYVKVHMILGGGFSLFGGLLDFHPIPLGDVETDDVLNMIEDYIEDVR